LRKISLSLEENQDMADIQTEKNGMTSISKYITIHSGIRSGKPCIVGTRITVADILGWLAAGMSMEEIEEDFPEIKREHILTALSFSANRAQSIKTVVYA